MMIEFTRNNYELFAIDFLDGKLDRVSDAAFHVFLVKNPDLKEIVLGGNEMILSAPDIELPEKLLLKKSEQEKTNPDQAMPRLKPGNEMYPGKANLKKALPVKYYLSRWKQVAAILLLVIFIKLLFNTSTVEEMLPARIVNSVRDPIPEGKAGKPVLNEISEPELLITETLEGKKGIQPAAIVNSNANYEPEKIGLLAESYLPIQPLGLELEHEKPPTRILVTPIKYVSPPASHQGRKKLASTVETMLELASSFTGGSLEINRSYSNSGELSSLNLKSEYLSFISIKSDD